MGLKICIKIRSRQKNLCESYGLSFFTVNIRGFLCVDITKNPLVDLLEFFSSYFKRTAVRFELTDFYILL